MSRKNWSNLLIFLAALNLALGMVSGNPVKLANWIAIPCCLALGTLARRRMIPKASFTTATAIGDDLGKI